MNNEPDVVLFKGARASLTKLPRDIQRIYANQISKLKISLKDPRLHIKKLRDLDGVFSFRITRNYRALFYFQNPGKLVIFAIGDRKDIYRSL